MAACSVLCRSGWRAPMVGKGHFDQLPPTGPSVGCRFGQRTFAWAARNGQDAPAAAIPHGTKAEKTPQSPVSRSFFREFAALDSSSLFKPFVAVPVVLRLP